MEANTDTPGIPAPLEQGSVIEIGPQPGPQTRFLSSPADIVIYGGAAGGGKTWGMLLEAIRNVRVSRFRAAIFRRQRVDIKNSGALWDQACEIYPLAGGLGTRFNLTWQWPGNAKVQFSHLEHESDVSNWAGSEVAMIGFEELTQFSEKQFWRMLARNRSTCGVRPYVRATCNPDSKSWVKPLIAWYLNPDTGYPIPERDGVVRWLARVGDDLQWGDSRQELVEKFGTACKPKSFTFIAANVFDNPALLTRDPSYLSSLQMLPLVDREQLLGGNWNISAAAGTMFRSEWFRVVEAIPAATRRVRTWDLAASEPSPANPNPDWTVGLKMSRADSGLFCIEDMVRLRKTSGTVMTTILNTASQDGRGVTIRIVHDPGQAGKHQAHDYAVALAGYDVVLVPQNRTKGDKVTHAKPASRQAENGNITIYAGADPKTIIDEAVSFPDGDKDDIVDALADGVIGLTEAPVLKVASATPPSPAKAQEKAEGDHYAKALAELERRRAAGEQGP